MKEHEPIVRDGVGYCHAGCPLAEIAMSDLIACKQGHVSFVGGVCLPWCKSLSSAARQALSLLRGTDAYWDIVYDCTRDSETVYAPH